MLALIEKLFRKNKFSGFIKIFSKKPIKVGSELLFMLELEKAKCSLKDRL